MGGGSSTPSSGAAVREVEVREKVITKYVVPPDTDEQQKVRLLAKLEKQMQELQDEIKVLPPAITKDIKLTVLSEEDVTLLRYSQLQDKTVLFENIRQIFKKHPLLEFINQTAESMIATMSSTEEMTDIMRWNKRHMVKRVGDTVYGFEAHYKVQILQKEKGKVFTSKETVMLIAYKCLVHSMELNPANYPDDEQMKKLTF